MCVSAGASRRGLKGLPAATPIPQVHGPSGLSPATDEGHELFFLTARPTLGWFPGHLRVTSPPPTCS